MKIIKFLMIALLSVTLVNCSTDEGMEFDLQVKSTESLSVDATFIAAIESNLRVIDKVADIDKVKNLTEKGDLNEIEIEELSRAMGFEDFHGYELYFNEQKERVKYLEKEYLLSSYTTSELTAISQAALLNSRRSESDDNCNCERIRVNCIVAAGGAATLAHLGCFAADFTIIAGILCHGAVLVIQDAVSDNCNAEAENCERECLNGVQ